MIKKLLWTVGLSWVLVGVVSAQYMNTIYSEPNDGMVELRSGWTNPNLHGDNDGGATSATGEWYGEGLVCSVLPFQLPNMGAVVDPFDSASLSTYLTYKASTIDVDLYYVRSSTNSDLIATNDYFSGTADPNATLLQASFINSGTPSGSGVTTDASASANLLASLNTAYDGGAGAGDYVFLRLSYPSTNWNTSSEETLTAKINTRNNSDAATWPTITLLSTLDSDGDGLPNGWEGENNLDPHDGTGANGADGNPDDDGLTNAEEFALGTDPQDDDTDHDGLLDGDEVFYSTDPLDADSDDDYLNDGEEVDNATDPLDIDSDDDDANDATEVFAGSDPNSGASVPENDRPEVIGIEGFDYTNGVYVAQVGGELFDYDNNTVNDAYTGHTGASSFWSIFSGSPSINGGRLVTAAGSGLLRPLNGAGTGGEAIALFGRQATFPEVDSQVFYAKIHLTRAPGAEWSGLSTYANGQEEVFFGVGDDGFGSPVFKIDEAGEGASLSSIVATNSQTYTLVIKMDGRNASLWVDPDLGSAEPTADRSRSILSDNSGCSSIRLASGGAGNTYWDNLTVGTTWSSLSSAAGDDDGDSLPNSWEIANGLDPNDSTGDNGSSGNPDDDGLINLEELTLGTNPQDDDTDGDTLIDGDEVNIYGSSPLLKDTDGDTIQDDVEVNTYGTDPVLADTDDDGEDDGVEIVMTGSNPTNAASNAAAMGVPAIDGSKDAIYGQAVSVQTVNTEFGDNYSELNAGYAYSTNGYLYLLVTGNLEANWNKLEIFIDSTDAVTTNVLTTAGNDESGNMNGLTFDTGFAPEYHFSIRRDDTQFWIDLANLAADDVSSFGNFFTSGSAEGFGYTGTNAANAFPMGVAFDNSNTAGVIGGSTAADPVAATNVTTGLEICIALSDLGTPPLGSIKVAAMVNSVNHGYLSNQILGGLPAPQGNLATSSAVDFNSYTGDQFFSVAVQSGPIGAFEFTSMQLISGDTEVQLMLNGLTVGHSYKIQDSGNLSLGFSDVPGYKFTATNAVSQEVILPADTAAEPVRFFQTLYDTP